MSTITTTVGADICYEDWGSGEPIVFTHGWQLSSDDWDNHMLFFLSKGKTSTSTPTISPPW